MNKDELVKVLASKAGKGKNPRTSEEIDIPTCKSLSLKLLEGLRLINVCKKYEEFIKYVYQLLTLIIPRSMKKS